MTKRDLALGRALRTARVAVPISQLYLSHLFLRDESTIRSWEVAGVPPRHSVSVQAFVEAAHRRDQDIHVSIALRGRTRTLADIVDRWMKICLET